MRRFVGFIAATAFVLTSCCADASSLFPKWSEDLLQGVPGTSLTAEVDCQLIDTSHYTFDQAHRTLSDVPVNARIGSPAILANKSFTNGKVSANPLSFPSISGSTPITAMICYTNLGSAAADRLVVYYDGLNQVPEGGTVTVNFDATLGLFTL